ncbi:MAG: hypothetical protein ACRDLA_06870 [Thermoleophilaceae bacterium]
MTTIEHQAVETAPETAASHARPDTRTWLGQHISREVAVALAAGWVGFLLLADALQPEPARPESQPWFATALTIGLLGVLALLAVGLCLRSRWAMLPSLAAAAFLAADSVLCPVSGHHDLGVWVYVQAACALALAAASVYILRRPAAD